MLNDNQIREIKSDINYFVSQLIADRERLQQENDYLKGQNEILKQQLEKPKWERYKYE